MSKLNYKSWIYKEGRNRNVYVLETKAKFLNFNFDPLKSSRKLEQAKYVQGFFDAEGGLPKSKKVQMQIQFAQKSIDKIKIIKQILRNIGVGTGKIHCPSKKVDPNYFRVYVLARSHKKFAKIVGSLHPTKQNILRKRLMI